MKIAYFSLFAFLVGVNLQPPVAGIEPAIEANTRPYLKQMIPIYRDFVFQGEQAYKKLLKLSAEEYLWQKDHFSKDFLTRSDSDYQKFDKAVDEFYHQNSTSFENKKPTIADLPDISFEAQTIFSILGLAEARQPRSYLEAQSIMSFALIMEDDSPFRAIFGAYRGLPMTEEGRPPLFTQSHWFWEFKVPEQLPLSYVSAISIPETESVPVVTDKSGLSPMKEISTVETQKAIERYAQNSHREFKKEILPAQSKDKPTMIIYTFLN